jgi:hypothetical protein
MDSNKDFNTYSINLEDLEDLEDTLIVGAADGSALGCYNTDTITLGSNHIAHGGVTLTSPFTFTTGPGTSGAGFCNNNYSISGAGSPWMPQSPASTRISLTGEDADVEVNGWSLVDAVKRIEQRLGLFQPNPELEAEWAELRELAEQYRKLEQHIRDKQATWDRIKAMPAPEVD